MTDRAAGSQPSCLTGCDVKKNTLQFVRTAPFLKVIALGSTRLGFEYRLSHLIAVVSWTNYLNFSALSFLSVKWEIIPPILLVCCEDYS